MTDDNCGASDDDHQVLVKIEFDLREEEGDGVTIAAATIQSHIHNVPIEVASQTLLTIAVKMLGDDMAHKMFGGIDNHNLAHTMGVAAAKVFLTNLINELPETIELTSLDIPDDVSELLEGN